MLLRLHQSLAGSEHHQRLPVQQDLGHLHAYAVIDEALACPILVLATTSIDLASDVSNHDMFGLPHEVNNTACAAGQL